MRIRLENWPRKAAALALAVVSGLIWFLVAAILVTQLSGKHLDSEPGNEAKTSIIVGVVLGFLASLTSWMAYRVGFRRRSAKGTYLSPYFILGVGVVLLGVALLSAIANPSGLIYLPAPILLGLGAIYGGVALIKARSRVREQIGVCESCRSYFQYVLIHNGFGDSAYAYCDECGKLCLLDCWYQEIPKSANVQWHKCIEPEIEPLLQPCSCGGHFKFGASPRCPTCHEKLSAERATTYLEKNAPGTAKGWRWQKNWTGCYCVIIESQIVRDNWLK
jgi:hypothetical protein